MLEGNLSDMHNYKDAAEKLNLLYELFCSVLFLWLFVLLSPPEALPSFLFSSPVMQSEHDYPLKSQ